MLIRVIVFFLARQRSGLVMKKEVWVHTCPIHGEEGCLAERTTAEQVHMCRSGPAERHFWRGTSRKLVIEGIPAAAPKAGRAE